MLYRELTFSAGMATPASMPRHWNVSFEQKITRPPADSHGNPISVKLRSVCYSEDDGYDDSVDFVYGTGEASYPLLAPMGDLVLPLLRFPEAVDFEVRVGAPEGEGVMERAVAVVYAKVVYTKRKLFELPEHAKTVQTWDKLCEFATKAREERREREERHGLGQEDTRREGRCTEGETGVTEKKKDPCRLRLKIETDFEIVQPAGSYSLNNTNVGWLNASTTSDAWEKGESPAVYFISAADQARSRLPAPFPRFAELMLQLLDIPEMVEVTVETYIPEGRAITKAMVVVKLLRDSLPHHLSTVVMKLYNDSSTAKCRRRQ
ncbi:unnamed protein product [Pylaiella littoralis]